ncbi:unnamed protein product [Didymodactylos carnosus]|uniref:NACHT domain-containing protein n=1 Tax=Didymodactylos carnosus TaxID=1234261 RepID=A0A8S2JVZ6_9BILA|nr:unnamed protein product [Didymodactylos carnosus]CAF3825027.1 unnamed protein product [Didymodactylos carnosus]
MRLSHFAKKNMINKMVDFSVLGYESLSEKSKGCDVYLDIVNNKLDKIRQEKLKKFRDMINTKLDDDNRQLLNLNWKDNGFQSDDSDYQRYLRTLNAAIFLRIKAVVDDHLSSTTAVLVPKLKFHEHVLYDEALIHLYHYQSYVNQTCLGFDSLLEKIKRITLNANKIEHSPLLILGARASGKTLLCTKIVQNILSQLGGSKNVYLIVRYYNLTNSSRNINELLLSICSQLNCLQHLNVYIKQRDHTLVDHYHTMLDTISKGQRPLILMIDGIEETLPQSYVTTNVNFYQTLLKILPPKIHVILSVNRNLHTAPHSDLNIRTLFKQIEKEDQIIALPLSSSSINIRDISTYVKQELSTIHRNYYSDILLQTISKQIHQQIEQPYIFFMLKLILNETYLKYLEYKKQKLNFDNLSVEDILDSYIDRCEQKFNSKICSFIFNYISASQMAMAEVELLDILSCNNEFFLELYSKDVLPKHLRFPPSLWLAVKNELEPFLSERYVDKKVLLCWSHTFIRRQMKQRYLKKVEDIRITHRDIANYFLEAFIESKPLIDLNKNFQIREDEGRRFISQQPLLYSDTLYNYRRIYELWYQLMHSGDIDRLKEYTLCCFEYLLAKIHGLSITQLLIELEIICSNILDVDVLLVQSILEDIQEIIELDPILLAGELINRLKYIKNHYSEHIENLYIQSYDWCKFYGAPVFVPLSSWLKSIPPLIITVLHCQDHINKIALTAYNQHIFCTTKNNEIWMYHIPSKKLVKKFSGHTDVINAIKLTYNSKFLISTSIDHTIKIWNLNSSDIEHTYSIQQGEILCLTVSHNNDHIVTGSKDRLVTVLRLETGEIEHSVEQHTDAVISIALTQDDTILVTASKDQTVKRWIFHGMQVLEVIQTIGSPINHMVISLNDTFIIVACEDNSVQVKSLVTCTHIHHLEGHTGEVTSLAVSSDSMVCYVGCSNGHLYVYNLRSTVLLRILKHHETTIYDMIVSADGCFLFTAAHNSIYVLNIKQQFRDFKTGSESFTDDRPITSLAISKEGDVAISGCEQGTVKLWNLIDGELTEHIMDHRSSVTQVALSHSYLFSLSASKDSIINVYDNELGEIITEFKGHSAPISNICILEDNRKILSSDEQNYIKTWWANNGGLIDSYNVPCKILGVSPDGHYVVSGSGDNVLKIWSLDDARVVRSIDHPQGAITCIAFRSDSQYLLSGGEDCSCKLWELASGKLTQVLVEHEKSITAIAITLDGKSVLTGGTDGLAIIWSFKDGTVVHKLLGHNDAMVCVAFTIDGTVAVTASHDGLLSTWSTVSGIHLAAFHFNYTLVKLLVSQNGARYAAILENNPSVAMLMSQK